MNRLLSLLAASLLLGYTIAPSSLSRKERKFAAHYLRETRDSLLIVVKHLSDTQLRFKPSPERWSIAQCIEHLAISESSMMQDVDSTLVLAPDPARRKEITVADTTVLRVVTDRSHKSKAAERLRPHDKYPGANAALEDFVKLRNATINFVMTSDADLRDHYMKHGLMGTIDDYQWILVIGAHSRRHTYQIEEVMADPNFPKN